MSDKMPAVMSMLIVLFLVYLSNSGKLGRISSLLRSPDVATGTVATPPPTSGPTTTNSGGLSGPIGGHGF